MIKEVIIPKRTKCPRCGKTWEYENEDVQTRVRTYSGYANLEETEVYDCIVCPYCGFDIKDVVKDRVIKIQ